MHSMEMEILKNAILNEHEGHYFYQLAAEKAGDEEVKAVFLSLAAEEQEHEKWLRSIFKDLMGHHPPAVEAFTNSELSSPGIFTSENIKKAGSLVVSALHIGIMMEKASTDYYQDAAVKTQLPEVKEFYLKLADWEHGHMIRLEEAYDFAKEEWWSKQGFSPA